MAVPLSGGSWFHVLAVSALNFVRRGGRDVGDGAAAADVRACEAQTEVGERAGGAEEQVAHVLLRS